MERPFVVLCAQGGVFLGVGTHSCPREIRSLVHSVHLPKLSLIWSSKDR